MIFELISIWLRKLFDTCLYGTENSPVKEADKMALEQLFGPIGTTPSSLVSNAIEAIIMPEVPISADRKSETATFVPDPLTLGVTIGMGVGYLAKQIGVGQKMALLATAAGGALLLAAGVRDVIPIIAAFAVTAASMSYLDRYAVTPQQGRQER